MTSYDSIYKRFLQKITDYDLPNVSEEDLSTMLQDWLISAVSKFRKCNADLSKRDDDFQEFSDDLSDEEIEILSLLMVGEWLEPQINSVLLTHQVFAEKEQKYYAQANHLSALKTLRDDCRLEARKLMRDYTFANNSYLN